MKQRGNKVGNLNLEAINNFCHSCGAPLDLPEFKSKHGNYCIFCADESGSLKPKSIIQESCAEWFLTWMPGIDKEKAMIRAEHYIHAMPAWSND
jgi:putative zinc ribbon protein